MDTLLAAAPTATSSNAEATLQEGLRWLRHHNIPYYNAQPGKVALLGDNEVNAQPLVGRFGPLRCHQLTVVEAATGLPLTVTSGTQLLALAVDLTRPQPRILVDALTPQGRKRELLLTARQADLARGEDTNHSLLADVLARLRALQKVRVSR
jgi:hypothetical protein